MWQNWSWAKAFRRPASFYSYTSGSPAPPRKKFGYPVREVTWKEGEAIRPSGGEPRNSANSRSQAVPDLRPQVLLQPEPDCLWTHVREEATWDISGPAEIGSPAVLWPNSWPTEPWVTISLLLQSISDGVVYFAPHTIYTLASLLPPSQGTPSHPFGFLHITAGGIHPKSKRGPVTPLLRILQCLSSHSE